MKVQESGLAQLIRNNKRFISYALIGGVNVSVDVGMFHLLYMVMGLPVAFCQAASYISAVFISFVLNRNITFRDGDHPKLVHEFGRFLAVNAVSLGTSVLGIHLLVSVGVHTTLAKAMVTALTAMINYFGYKRFVFRIKGR